MQNRVTGIILQARMGSSRLPGKVMKPMAGKPMVQWIIERLKTCKKADKLIVATSKDPREAPLVDLLKRLDVAIFRGSEANVLERYCRCAQEYGLDDIIRATADNPLVDADACDRLIDYYKDQELDYATIVTCADSGFPVGVGVEVFTMQALIRSWSEGQAPHHREHVNEYILENPDLFKQGFMPAPQELCAPELSLTVDTESQFKGLSRIYAAYQKVYPAKPVSTSWAIKFVRENKLQNDGIWKLEP